MPNERQLNQWGESLESIFCLRTSPMAVKMLISEEEIPEGAIRPKRDRNEKLAQCQAFALSRRERETIVMLKEDNWCFAPLIAYGHVERPDDERFNQFLNFPAFDLGKYIGIVSAPLKTANFEPDVVIIYTNPAGLRDMLSPIHFQRKEDMVDYHFFPPACAYLMVPVIKKQRFMVALPDPGEHMRALPTEEEIILSVPRAEMDGFIEGITLVEAGKLGYKRPTYSMNTRFPQPPMYQELFAKWGLAEDSSD